MKKIKKIITLVTLAACAALMLCSCGNKKALASISVASPINLQLGESKQVELTGVLRDGTTVTGDELAAILERKGLRFESMADSVASIDANGRLTANGHGTTEISIYSQNNRLTAGAVVNVVEPLQGFELDDIYASTKSELVQVEYTTIPENADAGTVTVTVGDESIARVDENNNIIPIAAGTTTVTISSDKGPSKTVNFKVTEAPKKLYADDLYVEIGETKSINVYTDVEGLEAGEGGTKYTFENGSNAICAVNVNGEVTGITVGESTVKIQNEYGLETEATTPVATEPPADTALPEQKDDSEQLPTKGKRSSRKKQKKDDDTPVTRTNAFQPNAKTQADEEDSSLVEKCIPFQTEAETRKERPKPTRTEHKKSSKTDAQTESLFGRDFQNRTKSGSGGSKKRSSSKKAQTIQSDGEQMRFDESNTDVIKCKV